MKGDHRVEPRECWGQMGELVRAGDSGKSRCLVWANAPWILSGHSSS